MRTTPIQTGPIPYHLVKAFARDRAKGFTHGIVEHYDYAMRVLTFTVFDLATHEPVAVVDTYKEAIAVVAERNGKYRKRADEQ